VLIINRYMSVYGGAETLVKEAVSRLNALGVTTRILTLNISEEVKKLCLGMDIVIPEEDFAYTFRSQSFWQSLGIVKEIQALRRLVKKHSPEFDVINAHNFPASWVVRGLRKPVVWMCNEVPNFYNNPKPSLAIRLLRNVGISFDKHIVNRDIGFICVADEYNAKKVKQRYRRESEIIHYGVEYDFFSQNAGKEETIQKYNLKNNFVLLQVGMLSPEKNQLKSIRAFEALKGVIPNLKLVLAGRPQNPYAEMLKRYIAGKGLSSDIVFTGHISKQEVRALYHLCNIALFPVKTQGGWLAPFEALCAGKPIVTSTTMGAASLIKRQNIGTVNDDFIASLRGIYNEYNTYLTMAEQARAWVKENITWELFTKKMIKVFEKTLEGMPK